MRNKTLLTFSLNTFNIVSEKHWKCCNLKVMLALLKRFLRLIVTLDKSINEFNSAISSDVFLLISGGCGFSRICCIDLRAFSQKLMLYSYNNRPAEVTMTKTNYSNRKVCEQDVEIFTASCRRDVCVT